MSKTVDRVVWVNAHPHTLATRLALQNDWTVVTGSRLAARAIAARSPQTLRQLAVAHLGRPWPNCRVASGLEALRCLRAVLGETLRPKDRFGTAKVWLPAVRDLLQSGPQLPLLRTDEVRSLRIRQLLAVAHAFQQTLHDQQLIDESELYWRTLDLPPTPKPLLIYGYFQPRRDELAWLDAIAGPGSALILPQPDHPCFADVRQSVDWLQHQGWTVQCDSAAPQTCGDQLSLQFLTAAASPPAAVQAHHYDHREAEIRGVLTQVKTLLNQQVPARSIVLIARDETAYGPQLLDVAWEYQIPVRALYQIPLLSTRLGTWLKMLIEVLVAGFPFEQTAQLLSHPLCSNPDREFWAIVRQEHPQGFAAWQAIATAHLDLDLQPLGRVNQARRRDTWVDWWKDCLHRFNLYQRANRWPRDILAVNALRQHLAALANNAEAEILTWADFRQELLDLLESLTVPAQPGRGGVELHGPQAVLGARYRYGFVLGMAEGLFPAPIQPDPVVDFFDRRTLEDYGVQLPSAAALARQEALYFYGMVQTVTERVSFSYAIRQDKDEQLPSPYLQQLNLKTTEPPPKAIASPEEERRHRLQSAAVDTNDPVLGLARHAWAVELRRESEAAADEYDGAIALPFDRPDWHFSVTQLTQLGQCPFKWFAHKLLNLSPPQEPEDDLSASLCGRLHHKTLELLITHHQTHPDQDLTDPALIDRTYTEAEQALTLPALPAWEHQRPEQLATLALVLKNSSFLPAKAEPIALEQRFTGEWHGLQVSGQVDRIDRTPNGLVLIDYKTGTKPPKGIKNQQGQAAIDLQIPLYREVIATLYPGETVIDAYYYSLKDCNPIGSEKSRLKQLTPKMQAELQAAIERCKTHLTTGNYPVQPDVKGEACNYCDYQSLCRQGDRLRRKAQGEHHATH
ncbi:PD-(D/E)XK nuclease family protein [Spirulina major CS-329]|uniref:PD-(D/E)XK nuclease family protein n=1 Tax=Spirulina TaxID=1154 RepID=UPI00232D3730|nr:MULTISPECIES: PD-(D/E)XK nuclease family protein [Spirulina]MDB9494551.1 PD-(D/E)XK nuclease family protein [Spirulina subsalsa CS-330]MDB9504969.1 PD-(D/E)XK nuclease family protein [Spirulina major CS-329]